jgi:hypothetical protein
MTQFISNLAITVSMLLCGVVMAENLGLGVALAICIVLGLMRT